MKNLCQSISADLPKEVVKINSSRPAFPESRPSGQIVIGNTKRRLRRSQSRFDAGTVIAACNDMNFVAEAEQSLSPIPADARLRALIRFTCICRQQELHICRVPVWPWQFGGLHKAGVTKLDGSFAGLRDLVGMNNRKGSQGKFLASPFPLYPFGCWELLSGFSLDLTCWWNHVHIERCAMNAAIAVSPESDWHRLVDGSFDGLECKSYDATDQALLAESRSDPRRQTGYG